MLHVYGRVKCHVKRGPTDASWCRVQADAEYALKLQEDEFREREEGLDLDKRRLRQTVKEHEYADQQHVLQIRQEHYKEISMLRLQFEHQVCARVASTSLTNYRAWICKLAWTRVDLAWTRVDMVHAAEWDCELATLSSSRSTTVQSNLP